MYDWANSVYSLSIATAIFPIYYKAVTETSTSKTVFFFGREFLSDALYSYAVSAAFLIVALLSPLLSSIADYKGNKLSFLKFFCYLGSISCASLYFFDGTNIEFGILCFILAGVGFSGSLVFYNAFLKEIAEEKQQDKVSAKGFAMGYVGSVILLVVSLILIMFYKSFGFANDGQPTRISFVLVGLWWVGFAQIPFYFLKRFKFELKETENTEIKKGNSIWGGYAELKKVWNQLRKLNSLKRFLLAFFFFNMAVQTIMYLAVLFGESLKMDSTELIITILIIQLVAIVGANLFSFISNRNGNIGGIMIAIVVWISICVSAYFTFNKYHFFVDAFFVGMVMGGIQSLSRSTYSKMLPPTKDTASFFSFYDVTDKIGTVIGTSVFGFVTEQTGNIRNSVLTLTVFFVIGFLILSTVQNKLELKEANA